MRGARRNGVEDPLFLLRHLSRLGVRTDAGDGAECAREALVSLGGHAACGCGALHVCPSRRGRLQSSFPVREEMVCRNRRAEAATTARSISPGIPMRPDVALAFDRMAAAAREEAGAPAEYLERLPLRRRAGAHCSPHIPTRSGSLRPARAFTATPLSWTSDLRRHTRWLVADASPIWLCLCGIPWEAWH